MTIASLMPSLINWIDIQPNSMLFIDVEGGNCSNGDSGGDLQNFYETVPIDISGYSSIYLTANFAFWDYGDFGNPTGVTCQTIPADLESNPGNGLDNLTFEYSLNSGPWTYFDPGLINLTDIGTGGGLSQSSPCISGNTIAVRMQFGTQSVSEGILINSIDIFEGGVTPNTQVNSDPVCEGDNITLTENGVGAVMWSWNGPGGSSVNQSWTITNATLSDAGTYDVTITDAIGCTSISSVVVNVSSAPTASISVMPTSGCQGDNVTFTISGTPNATVTYFNGTNNQTIVLNAAGNATIPATLGVADLTFSLVDVSINGLCTQALVDNATVSVTPPPTASISVMPTSGCQGDNVNFTISGTPNATVTYFNGTNNQTIVLNAAGNATIPATLGAANLTYSLVDVSINGLCTQALVDNATVSVTPPPTASISVMPTSGCQGDNVNFTISGTPNATVTYFNGTNNQTIVLNAAGNATIPATLGAANLTYSLVDVSINGLCTQALVDNATVSVTPASHCKHLCDADFWMPREIMSTLRFLVHPTLLLLILMVPTIKL